MATKISPTTHIFVQCDLDIPFFKKWDLCSLSQNLFWLWVACNQPNALEVMCNLTSKTRAEKATQLLLTTRTFSFGVLLEVQPPQDCLVVKEPTAPAVSANQKDLLPGTPLDYVSLQPSGHTQSWILSSEATRHCGIESRYPPITSEFLLHRICEQIKQASTKVWNSSLWRYR